MNKAWGVAAIALLGGCVHRPEVVPAPAPVCTPGALLFSWPELPQDLQPTKDGSAILVVDPGGLELRSAQSFAVLKRPAPGVDGWVSGSFSEDGASWTGHTVDGQQYRFNTSDWTFERLYDSYVGKEERQARWKSLKPPSDEDAIAEARQHATDEVSALLARYRVPAEAVPELEATAYALTQNPTRLWAITPEQVVHRINLDEQREEAQWTCSACSEPVVGIVADGDSLVLVDAAARALRFRSGGELDRASPLDGDAALESGLPVSARERLGVPRKLLPLGRKFAWVSTKAMGLYEVKEGKAVSSLRVSGMGGFRTGAIWTTAVVGVIAPDAAVILDTMEGRELQRIPGDFGSAFRLRDGSFAFVAADGHAWFYESPRTVGRAATAEELAGGEGAGEAPSALATGTGPFTLLGEPGPQRAGQLRSKSWIATDGTRFLLGGEGKGETPPGALQLFCTPDSAGRLIPPPPRVPEVAVVDAVREIALRQVPAKYESLAAEDSGAAWLLAEGELFKLEPGATAASFVAIPEPKAAFDTVAAREGEVWLAAPYAVAQRKADGSWARWQLDGAGKVEALQPFAGGALLVRRNAEGLRAEIVGGPSQPLPSARAVFTSELPDGALVVSGDPKSPFVYRFREGRWGTDDALSKAVRDAAPHGVWSRRGLLVVLAKTWRELDPATGKILSELPVPIAAKRNRKVVGPKPAPTPYLDSLDQELIRFLDREGRPLFLAPMRGPAWLREYETVSAAADTRMGTWVLKADAALLFWDGKQVTAYFHPATREARIRELE